MIEHPTNIPSTRSAIELADLLRRCMGKVDFARRMLGRFEETFCEQVEELQNAPQHDRAAIAQLAHRMKGAAANIGAAPLVALLSELNHAADEMATSAESIEKLVGEVGEAWREACEFMQTATFEEPQA